MKTFLKGCVKGSLIVLAIGIVMAGIGFMSGGFRIQTMKYYDDNISEEYKSVSSLEIDVPVGEIHIVDGKGFSLEASNVNGDYFSSKVQDDGTWVIKDTNKEGISIFGTELPIFIGGGPDYYGISKLVITIPENFTFDNVNIRVGAGQLVADKLKVDGVFDFDVKAGDIEIHELVAKDANISCNFGNIEIEDASINNGDFDCKVGDIYLNLDRPMEDYDLYVDCRLGDVHINDSNYEFSVSKRIKSENADNRIKLSCGIGQIEIKAK